MFIAFAPGAFAVDPYQNRPYWTGVPTGGYFTECAGMLVTKAGYGLVPARSTYTEIKYSNGGYCNNFHGSLPAGAFYASSGTWDSSGAQCDGVVVYNSYHVATVVATANACSGGTAYVYGTSSYFAAGFSPYPWQDGTSP